jgi:flagellar hook-associated protein FlgK
MDEEMTNLINLSRHNAAAKIVTTVDEMLDKIINGMLR